MLGGPVEVDICTQPFEPMVTERVLALHRAVMPLRNVQVRHYAHTIEQNPEAPGFWDKWVELLKSWGFERGDLIVASESYGNKLAELLDGKYMPYDPYREITNVKATLTRASIIRRFDELLPEFQQHVRSRVTIFGAESTGKTTLAKSLAQILPGHYLMEWARPYLETVKNEITNETMTDIWEGQFALQRSATLLTDKPFIVQDTDLYSTLGYWGFWKPDEVPAELVRDAALLRSDLYLVTQSNIPFEVDPLRYGGDKRESDDAYWIDLCEKYNLNYRALTADDKVGKLREASSHIFEHFAEKNRDLLDFRRSFN